MSNKIEYNENYAFHPGYYIAEIIEDMGISQDEFATRMGTTGKTLSKLINGQCNLSGDLAQKIATMLGSSVEVWLNLQKAYHEKIIEIERKKVIDEQIEIMQLIDYSFFVKYVKLAATRSVTEKITNLCKYLMISDLRILAQTDFLVNFRTGVSNVQSKNIINAQAWLQTAMNFAKEMNVKDFNAIKLRNNLSIIRQMTVQSPSEFLPGIRDILAECGVAFVLLPYLKNSGINGAVKWYGRDRVVLAMNNRRCYIDTFWFSLFHEIKHVLQQKVKKVFISSDVEDMTQIDSMLEEEADAFAQNYLIPQDEYLKLTSAKYLSDDDIMAFAKSINIHPGIVAGRLQHDRVIPQSRCVKMKERFCISVGSEL